jgi:flagellar hook-basal body complex protein FliE
LNTIDSTRLLLEMRALALKAQAGAGAVEATGASGAPPVEFAAAMKAAASQVSAAQQGARAMAEAFEAGAPGADLTRVMLEVQKASLSFKAMTEVRNKLVAAYQEVMNMPI